MQGDSRTMPVTQRPGDDELQDRSLRAARALVTIERRQTRGRHPEIRLRRVTGFDPVRGRFSRHLSEQCRQALRNGAASLASTGLSMHDVVRVTYLMRDADGFPACFPLLRDAFGDARPAATLFLVGRFDVADMQIELELLARRAGV